MSDVNIQYDGFKAIINGVKTPPSIYWEVKEEQKEALNSLIRNKTLPLTYPDNSFNSGLLMYRKVGNGSYEVLSGLLPTLSKQYRFEVVVNKVNTPLPSVKPFLKSLRDYQEESVNKILKNKRGVISIATGGGKTRIISELINQYKNEGLNIVVLVPTINLLSQMVNDINEYNNISLDIGKIGGGKVELNKEITVAIPNTLYSRKDNEDIQSFLNNIDILLVDEVHVMMSPTCCFIYSCVPNVKVKVGFSATPQFNLLTEGMFGPILHEESPEELIKNNVIECPEVIFHKVKPKYLTGNISSWVLNRNIVDRIGKFSPSKYAKLTNELIIKHKSRNELIVSLVEKALEENRGPAIIVVSKVDSEVNHPDYLLPLLKERLGLDVPVIKGSNKSSKDLIQALKEGELKVAIAGPKILQFGANIPILNCVVLAGAGKDDKILIQQIGRVLRSHESKMNNKPLIISFMDTQFPFTNQAKSRWDTCVEVYGEENVTLVGDNDE